MVKASKHGLAPKYKGLNPWHWFAVTSKKNESVMSRRRQRKFKMMFDQILKCEISTSVLSIGS